MPALRGVDPRLGSVRAERGRVPVLPAARCLAGRDPDMQDQAKGTQMVKKQLGAAEEARLMILVEQMVRAGASEEAITEAVREASRR